MRLPDGRVWLRVADPSWPDPLDGTFAGLRGGRWNAPGAGAVLYLNADVATARFQIDRMLEGTPVTVEDLDDEAFVLAFAVLPRAQICADAVSDAGLRALGLPGSYPLDRAGAEIPHSTCQPIGAAVRERRLRGIWYRSACTGDGRGRELAWLPATSRSVATVAKPSIPLGDWRHAATWADVGLPDQADPSTVT